jgi:hypothetical protein
MIRRLRYLVAAATLLGLSFGLVSASPAAQATSCEPDWPCTIYPPQPGKPKVSFGCGTVIVTSGNITVVLPILPCPGPVII